MKKAALALLACLLAVPLVRAAEVDTPAANLALIRAQINSMNQGDWKGALDLYTRESKNFGRPVGRAVMARIFEDIFTTFPDWHVEILDSQAMGDSVIVREMTSGTHRGVGKIPVNGGLLVGVAPTNKHFEAPAFHWYKLKNGKIVDHFATRDDLTMMWQLGLTPAPKPFDWTAFAAQANQN